MHPFPMDEAHLRWEFELISRQPLAWIQRAVALRRSSDVLFERYVRAVHVHQELFPVDESSGLPTPVNRPMTDEELVAFGERGLGPVACMLLGLAIENLAKALLVHRQPELVSGEGIGESVGNHGIRSLLSTLKLDVDAHTEQALGYLSDLVLWAGKYPVPKNPLKAVEPAPDGRVVYRPVGALPPIRDASLPVYRALADALKAEVGDALNIL